MFGVWLCLWLAGGAIGYKTVVANAIVEVAFPNYFCICGPLKDSVVAVAVAAWYDALGSTQSMQVVATFSGVVVVGGFVVDGLVLRRTAVIFGAAVAVIFGAEIVVGAEKVIVVIGSVVDDLVVWVTAVVAVKSVDVTVVLVWVDGSTAFTSAAFPQ